MNFGFSEGFQRTVGIKSCRAVVKSKGLKWGRVKGGRAAMYLEGMIERLCVQGFGIEENLC